MKIGDVIYKYLTFHGFATYKITGVIKRKRATLYEVDCQACNHPDPCQLLVADVKGGRLAFAGMLNRDEGHEQHWHDDDYFYKEVKSAQKAKYHEVIRNKKGELETAQKLVERLSKELVDLEEHLKNITPTNDQD